MRTFLCTVVVMLALSGAACSGEEQPPVPPQAESELVESEESEASSAAAPDPSNYEGSETVQSEGVDELQPPAQQAASRKEEHQEDEHDQPETSGELPAPLAQALDCDQHPFAAEAARWASLDALRTEEDDAGPADREIEHADDQEYASKLLYEARAAMAAWFSRLETLTLEASLIAHWDQRCISLALSSTIRLDPLAALSVGDYGDWFELWTGLPLPESAEEVQMQDYLYEGRVYSTITGLRGWGGSRWHYPLDYDDGALHQWLAVKPSALASYGKDGDELDCALDDGGIAEGRHEGEEVWVVTCTTTVGNLLPFESYLPDSDAEAQSWLVRITISQDSGAPLVTEYRAVAREHDGRHGWVLRRVELTGWNEPTNLPQPEPLLEGNEFAELEQQLRARAAVPERLLDLAQRWKADPEDARWTLEIHLEKGATDSQQGMRLSESRSAETLERTLFSYEPSGDRGFAIRPGARLLWNRDGLQVSDADVDGEPVWRPSAPDEHGFGSTTLEEVLAERDWVDLGLFSDLLELSEPNVEPPEDGKTNYQVWFTSGVLEPGDTHFERFASLIERGYSELRIGDIEVLRIDLFGMSIELDGGRRRLTSHSVGAEVVTDSGTFGLALRSSLD